jgi:phospholipase D1/2
MDFHNLLRKAKQGIEELLPGEERHSLTHDGHECHEDHSHAEYGTNRYCSFAPQSSGHAKWYVDGASYFWAVSMALEGMLIQCPRRLETHSNPCPEAREYIYILDWWLR